MILDKNTNYFLIKLFDSHYRRQTVNISAQDAQKAVAFTDLMQLHSKFSSCFTPGKWQKTPKISLMPPRCPGNRNATQNLMLAERHVHSGSHVATVFVC